jgi:PPOX class probable F420-dependent enzyme
MPDSARGTCPVDWAASKTVLLETRRKDGRWVPTPVSLVVDDGLAYFRTYDAAGKAKRLRNDPEVRVAPSDLRGQVRGPSVPGRARLLQGAEAERARRLLARRFPLLHGVLVPLIHRRRGWTTLHYELELRDQR